MPSDLLLRDLQVVVDETERRRDKPCVKRTSQTKRLSGRAQRTLEMNDRADDEHAAHRWRALFAAVQFGEVTHFVRGANRLADLQRRSVFE